MACSALASIGLHQPSIWDAWRPATCMPARCFCETLRPNLIRQSSNALSGLAFLPVGLLILFRARAPVTSSLQPTSLIRSHPVYPAIYGTATLLIGVGTFFYHASMTFWGQTADVLGMYLIATFLVLFNISRVRSFPPARVALVYAVGNAILLAGLIVAPGARRYLFALLVLVALLFEMWARRKETAVMDARLLGAAVGILAFGFLVWILDITRTVCAPNSWVQGHAVWHVAGAMSLGLLFLYYSGSETSGRADQGWVIGE